MKIKNIIFDLGGVILNLDFKRTHQAFEKLGAVEFANLYSHAQQSQLFDDFETGKITPDHFRNELKNNLQLNISDQVFDQAWNAMLLDLPESRLDFLANLKKTYRIFLFSNTNEIHLEEFFRLCRAEYRMNSLEDYFDKEYFSCRLGKRKPDPEAFKFILQENNLVAAETLFIDDTLRHVKGAQQAGLHGIHLTPDKSLTDLIVLN